MATKENISFVTVDQPLTWSHLSTMQFLLDSSPGAGLSRSLSVRPFSLLDLHRALTLFLPLTFFLVFVPSHLWYVVYISYHFVSLFFPISSFALLLLAISNYVFSFAALGGEYKAKQNRCCEVGVSFNSQKEYQQRIPDGVISCIEQADVVAISLE